MSYPPDPVETRGMQVPKQHSALRDYLDRHDPPQLHGDVDTISKLNALHAEAVKEYESLVEQLDTAIATLRRVYSDDA